MKANTRSGPRKAVTALNIQVLLTSSSPSNGSLAATEKPARLNPDFTRWLMGFPARWGEYAPKS
jgi:hypothetical protein